ncbi:MAG: ABC transporter substrate-binding protein [Magnetospirillum sp. WYHS-4]
MTGRRRLLAGMAACALFWADPVVAAPPTDLQEGARRHVESLAGEAIAALTKGLAPDRQVDTFRNLVERYFDVRTMGRYVFGDAWTAASKEQRAQLLKLFSELTVRSYLQRFGGYSGEKLAVTGSVPTAEGDVLVKSNVTHASRAPVKVDWRVRALEGRYRIVDVSVDGVSLGKTQRSEVSSLLHQSGGLVDRFLDDLRGRVVQMADRGN